MHRKPREEDDEKSSKGFLYNQLFAIPMIPCLVVLLYVSGQLTLATLIVGSLLTYVLEAIGSKEGSFVAVWVTLVAAQVSFAIQSFYLVHHSFFNLFFIFVTLFFSICSGLWVSLQFAWLHQFSPVLVQGMEKILFSSFIFPTAAILTWAATALNGIDNSPFYYSFILFIGYMTYGIPRPSSYNKKDIVIGSVESAVQMISVLILPLLFHIALYHKVMTELSSLTSALLLVCTPLCLFFIFQHKGTFWWTGISEDALNRFRPFGVILTSIVVIACLQQRVLLHSFSHLFAFPAPWNYILLSLSMFPVAFFITVHYLGYTRVLDKSLFLLGALVVSGAASLVVGLPWYLFPFSVSAALTLVSFYLYRQFPIYAIFCLASTTCLLWFIHKSFWFLQFEFYFGEYSVSLQSLSLLILVLFLMSLIIPAVIYFQLLTDFGLHEILITGYAIILTIVEVYLHRSFDFQVYPEYLNILSTILGVYVVTRLKSAGKIGVFSCWTALSFLMAKPLGAMSENYLDFLSFLLLVACSSIFYLTSPDRKFSAQEGLLYTIAVGLSAFFARNYAIHEVITLIYHREFSYSVYFAVFLFVWSVGCLPITFRHFSGHRQLKNANILVIVVSILLLFLEPQLNTFHLTTSDELTSESPSTIPQWCLLISVVMILGALFGVIPLSSSKAEVPRLLFSVITGLFLGISFAATYIPYSFYVYLLFSLIFVSSAILFFFIHWPSASLQGTLPSVYLFLIMLLPILYVVEGQAFSLLPAHRRKESLKSSRAMLVAIYAAINILIALIAKYKLSLNLLLQASAKRKTDTPSSAPTVPSSGPYFKGTKLTYSDDVRWLVNIGNIACLLGFVLSVLLNINHFHGSELSIVFLAPIFLLLNPTQEESKGKGGVPILSQLQESNRYFPIICVTSIFLITTSLYHLLFKGILIRMGLFTPLFSLSGETVIPNPFDWSTFLHFILLLFTLPSHYYINLWMWDRTSFKSAEMLWITITPLNILPSLFSSLFAVRILGFIGLIGGVVLWYLSRNFKISGLKSL